MPRYVQPFKALHLGDFTIEWWGPRLWWSYEGYQGRNYGYPKGYWQFSYGPFVIIYNKQRPNL